MSDLINAERLFVIKDGPFWGVFRSPRGFIFLSPARLVSSLFVFYKKVRNQTTINMLEKNFENVKLNPLTYWL